MTGETTEFTMPDHDLDERIARLQRLAYGAGVPDPEREAAAAELAALRTSRESASGRRGGADGHGRGGAEPDAGRERPATVTPSLHDDSDIGTSDPRPAWARRSLVTASAVALLVGLAAGWALGVAVPRAGEAGAVPAAETAAWRVFDAPVPNGDRVRYPAPPVDVDLDRDSRRLLAARSDGVRVVAVRSEDGRDACLVLVVPSGPSAAACTADGRFPADGLVVRTEQPGTGIFSATWDASGRVSLGPVE
jgi:hypothetical protein